MSAGERWHEHGPVKEDEPALSSSILLWMRGQASAENPVLPWEADPEAAFRPGPAAETAPENGEVLANLLRAIENTAIAEQFQHVLPAERAPVFSPPAEAAEAAHTAVQDAAAQLESAHAGTPEGSEELASLLRAIQNTAVAASIAAPPESLSEESPQSGSAGPPEIEIAQRAEIADSSPALVHEPQPDAAAQLEPAADDTLEPSKDLADLLRTLQNTAITTSPDSSPEPRNEEPPEIEFALRAETEETAPALNQDTEPEASAHYDPMAESESLALPLSAAQNEEADEKIEAVMPQGEERAAALLSAEPAEIRESASLFEPPVATPSRDPASQQNRSSLRRGPRGRSSSRQRSEYLLSIAAPTAVPPSAKPQPAEAATPAETAEAAEPVAASPVAPVLEPPSAVVQPEPEPAAKPAEPTRSAEPIPVLASPAHAEPEQPPSVAPAAAVAPASPPAPAGEPAPSAPKFAEIGTDRSTLAATGDLINGGLDRAEMQLQSWFNKWFGPPDPRHNPRVSKPPLVAYHWIVDVPQALRIADISAGGLRLFTKDRWSEGNIVSMTLQRTDKPQGSPESWIAVDFLVMRWCKDGVAGAFIPSAPGLTGSVAGRAENAANKKTLERFVGQLVHLAQSRNGHR